MLVAGLLAGCAAPSTPAPAATPAPLQVTDTANRTTVTLRVGQQLVVTLRSTYWSLQGSSDDSVLRALGAVQVSPSPGCVPGAGCGTVTARFVAAGAGSAVVTGSRTSCGEALLCTPANGRFTLTVQVRS